MFAISKTAMKFCLAASVFLTVFQVVYMRIELEDFYPYGPENGDTAVPTNDDGSSGLVNIGFPFPFFDDEHESLFVNTNGVISFLRQVSQYKPDPFPLGDNRRLIAPFWADVDTTRGGTVYYRETQDLAIRTRASEEIRRYFIRRRRFSAKWVMIVTWLNVAAFGGGSTPNNTFQAILTTDGINSFSIFYYNKITWTFGRLSRNIPAQAGFNAGDGIRYFNIPNSRTPAIINITSTSNYQDPGFWIFQVDGEIVEDHGCSFSGGGLELSPRSGIELGGTKVFIGGPCYSPDYETVCRFNKTLETTAVYVSPEVVYCITPPLYVVGRIQVELSLDGGATFNFTATFRSIPVDRNPPDIQGLEVEHWANSTNTILSWNPNEINASHVDIDVSQFDTFEFLLHPASLTSFKHVPNSGNYRLDYSKGNVLSQNKRRKRDINTASPIATVSITPSTLRVKRLGVIPKVAIFSAVFLVTWLVDINDLCNNWYASQDLNNIAALQEELPPCPTSFQQISADDQFVADSGIKRLLSNFYHPGSTSCFRTRTASVSGAGQQCCYNGNSLMVGPPGGGSLDVVSPDKSFWGHMGRDVLPWYACCKFTKNCGKYYERRPSDDGSRYVPPPTAVTRGDPHFSTFDGTSYTFNGYGEYILLQLNNGVDLEFQGRMIPILDDQGRRTRATALTALAVRANESDTVQVEFNNRRLIDVFVNGDRIEFDEQTRLDFSGVYVLKHNESKIGIYFTSGVSIDTRAIENFLVYQISIPTRFKGKTAGLLGFWDDNKDKEFLLPNGSFVHTNLSFETLHKEFGERWVVDRNRTLFTYRIGESYNGFRDVDFTPVFVDDTSSLFSNFTFEQEARSICGQNQECLFDIAVTGKTSVGAATLELINELEEKVNNSKIVAEPIYFGCDGVQDSKKTTDFCGVCGGDNASCTDCEGNVRLGFVNNGTCGFYLSWTEWSACFMRGNAETRTRNRPCSTQGQCRHLGGNVQYKLCMDNDDESKSLEFYLLLVGLPVLVLLLVIPTIILCYCYICKKKPEAARKPHASTHTNNAFVIS